MGVSKVEFAGQTLVDLTGDTVTPDSLLEGVTAHDASGAAITGTMPNNGRVVAGVGIGGYYYIDEGYHNGNGIIYGPSLTGDATAADVAEGKTFYSNSGTKLTGTHVCKPEYVAVTFNSALLSRINALSYTSVESGVVTAHYYADSDIPTTAFTALIVKGSVISAMADYSSNISSFKGTGDVTLALRDSNWYMLHFVANGAGNCTYG